MFYMLYQIILLQVSTVPGHNLQTIYGGHSLSITTNLADWQNFRWELIDIAGNSATKLIDFGITIHSILTVYIHRMQLLIILL